MTVYFRVRVAPPSTRLANTILSLHQELPSMRNLKPNRSVPKTQMAASPPLPLLFDSKI